MKRRHCKSPRAAAVDIGGLLQEQLGGPRDVNMDTLTKDLIQTAAWGDEIVGGRFPP